MKNAESNDLNSSSYLNFRIQIFSSKYTGIVDLNYHVEKSEILVDFISLFTPKYMHEAKKITISHQQRNTMAFQAALEHFVSKYKQQMPTLNRLKESFKKLADDEWFYVLPPAKMDTVTRFELESSLNDLNGVSSAISRESISANFLSLITNYEIVSFKVDQKGKIKIGNARGKDKQCRFCGHRHPDVTFSKEAHAVSEALGNKKLICVDECDKCNEFFDEEFERDFIYYHDLARTIHGVKNKENKVPKMKGKSYTLSKNDEYNLSIMTSTEVERECENGPPKKITLSTNYMISRQNIYKALCKFALSILDSEKIVHFADTKKWLQCKKEIKQLPKIAVLSGSKSFGAHPTITLFLRQTDNRSIPYLVGEFTFSCYIYYFIVPGSSMDDRNFLEDEEYSEFTECFKYITNMRNLGFADFSDNIQRRLEYVIHFQQIDDVGMQGND